MDMHRIIFRQIISGLAYCHEEGVCNRDIKLENTLLKLDDSQHAALPVPKICDFGFSKHVDDSAAKTRAGSVRCE